jgi:hypothetical protein
VQPHHVSFRIVECYKIATLNDNGMDTQPRITMLADLLHKQDIDIFLQEVTRPVFDAIRGFVAHITLELLGGCRKF